LWLYEISVNRIIPLSRVLIEKLTVPQVFKKCLSFYVTRRSVHKNQPPVSTLNQIYEVHIFKTVSLELILILSPHLRPGLPSGSFPQISSQNPLCSSDLPHNLFNTVMRRITTFRSKTDRTYNGGHIRLYYNIMIFYYNTTVLKLPTVFSTVTCFTGL
jgi:hypothetical protein